MKTTTIAEAHIAEKIAKFCVRFLKSSGRYIREPNGRYTWAYQGNRLLIPFTHGFDLSESQKRGFQDGMKLHVNGVFIGTIEVMHTYAYTRDFYILNISEDLQYNPSVITRFAQYAGMDTKNFDLSKLNVQKPTKNEEVSLCW